MPRPKCPDKPRKAKRSALSNKYIRRNGVYKRVKAKKQPVKKKTVNKRPKKEVVSVNKAAESQRQIDILDKKYQSMDEIYADETAVVKEDPMVLVIHGFLSIKTKDDEQIVFLKLNSVQKKFLYRVVKRIEAKKPVRMLILKARQMGISTIIEGIIYAYTSLKEGINSLVVADDVKGANYIFEMSKLYHEKLDDHLKPQLKHSNEKKLEFAGTHSQILIDTADNANVGRKYTIRYAHLSEVAFYKDLDKIMLGLNQAVPNRPGTMLFLESTANGIGNSFYDRWQKAKKGTSDWETVFIAWHELPEYKMKLTKGEFYPLEDVNMEEFKFLMEEKKLKRRFNLSDEQINWRRWCIVNNCNGDVDFFKQEYPSDDEEAFLMSGSLYFDRDAIAEQFRRIEKRREFLTERGVDFVRTGDIVFYNGRYVFRDCTEGRWRLYEEPNRDDQYCIGADAAEGLPHGDDSAACVLNKRSNRTAAAYNCTVDTDEFATDLIKAGHYFNMAMIAPESKGYGSAVCRKVHNHYGNIYRKIRDNTGEIDVSDELGWNTNSATRPTMLMQFKEEFREGATDIYDEIMMDQIKTFINNPEKKRPEAEKGKKDDLIFARAIAGMVRLYYPAVDLRRLILSKNRQKPKVHANQGYGFKS